MGGRATPPQPPPPLNSLRTTYFIIFFKFHSENAQMVFNTFCNTTFWY